MCTYRTVLRPGKRNQSGGRFVRHVRSFHLLNVYVFNDKKGVRATEKYVGNNNYGDAAGG